MIAPTALAMAVAAPVEGDTIRFTNNPWTLHRLTLAETMEVDHVTLVNDLAAIAHAVGAVPDHMLERIAGPPAPLPDDKPITVIGVGTGLGAALRLSDGTVQASEAGHIGFAPFDAFEDVLRLQSLRREHGRVSVERAASGPAIQAIHRALGGAEAEAIELWDRGLSGTDPVAADATERFCRILGGAVGDIVLAQGGFGGVVLAGGLGQRLRDLSCPVPASPSGSVRRDVTPQLMAGLPVKLLTHSEPGLLGAAVAYAKEHG